MVAGEIKDLDPPTLETLPADSPLEDVIEVLLEKDFSQIGLTRDDELVGVVSFRSIARAMLVTDQIHQSKRHFAERAVELAVEQPTYENDDDQLDDLFDLLRSNSYVVTVNDEREYGIVTDYDIREFYSGTLTPFIMIGETETAIRAIIRDVLDGKVEDVISEMGEKHEEFDRVDSLERCGFRHYELILSVNWNSDFSELFNEHRDFVRHLIEKLAAERNRFLHYRIEDWNDLDRDVIRLAHAYFTSFSRFDEERSLINVNTR